MRALPFTLISPVRLATGVFCGCVIAGAAPTGAQGKSPRNISVTVSDTAGNPIADATVAVAGSSFRASSDSRGQVEFRNVDWGLQRISVRKLGFREVNQPLIVPADGSIAAGITLQRAPADLGKVVVRDSGAKPGRLAGTGRFDEFYKRRRTGAGTFITREEIEVRNPGRAFDLFMGIAGVRLTYRGSTPLLSFARCKAGVEVFVDGQRLNDGINVLNSLHPNQIEAIEVYHGLASVPPQFSPKPSDCAAIVIWSRYH